ncbi:MAG: hypothetical protein VX911_05645 [Candidatus Latescibacterota bacterium]|nr:hypothetical protein [Candidatus Latescibacterota bacterium]
MSRYLKSLEEESVEHDVSKEIFLGIMMLMLCLGILILNVATPVWRVHRHEPQAGDVVILYGESEFGLSRDNATVTRRLTEWDFRRKVLSLVGDPEADLHLFLKGGSKDRLLRHAAYADSLLSTDLAGNKVRTAVYVHGW